MNQVSEPQQPNQSPPPMLFAVVLVTGELWQRGRYVPGSELTRSVGMNPNEPATYNKEIEGSEGQQALVIMEMFPNEDGSVEVFVSPVPGSLFDRQQTGLVFTLMPLTIQRTMTVARFDVWKQMLAEAQADALDTGDDDDDDDDDEIEPDPSVAGALPAANGAPAAGASS